MSQAFRQNRLLVTLGTFPCLLFASALKQVGGNSATQVDLGGLENVWSKPWKKGLQASAAGSGDRRVAPLVVGRAGESAGPQGVPMSLNRAQRRPNQYCKVSNLILAVISRLVVPVL